MTHATPNRAVLVTALLTTWIVWGSSFVAIVIALDSLPPLLLMSSRFVAAGTAALAIAAIARRLRRALGAPADAPTRRHWRDATIIGTGFVVVGMGATGWAATRLPTGIAALLVATAPLWIVIIQLSASRGRSFNALAMLGVATGSVGVAVLVAPTGGNGATHATVDPLAAGVLVASTAVWAASSLFARRASLPRDVLTSVGMQMLTGGLLLTVVAAGMGEFARLDVGAISIAATLSWTFLVVVASLGGFAAYGWLLQHASATTAATHAFVNPLVAVALGALALGETISSTVVVASTAIAAAVVLLLLGEARSARPARRSRRARSRRSVRASSLRRLPANRHPGFSPVPTPAFAARRLPRPARCTDGMDALAIDEAFDSM